MTAVSITPPQTLLQIKERPIPFQPEMIVANLNTRPGTWPAEPIDPLKAFKWQTRRIMKTQPRDYLNMKRTPHPDPNKQPRHEAPYFDCYCGGTKTEANPRGMGQHWCWWDEYDRQGVDWIKCRYGVPGDRLWGRESWQVWAWREDEPISIYYPADGTHHEEDGSDSPDYEDWYVRMATESTDECAAAGCTKDDEDCYIWPDDQKPPTRLRHSMFMPRWASRMLLEIKNIRVERVRDISPIDCYAEGIRIWTGERICQPDESHGMGEIYRDAYLKLFSQINAKSEIKNPYVWVIEYMRVE